MVPHFRDRIAGTERHQVSDAVSKITATLGVELVLWMTRARVGGGRRDANNNITGL